MGEEPEFRPGSKWSVYYRRTGFECWELRYTDLCFTAACRAAHIHLISQRGGEIKVLPATGKETV